MKQVITLLLLSTTFCSCSIVGNYYLLNNSQNDIEVIINLKSIPTEAAKDYILRIDNIDKRKIKYSTYKKMNKRIIRIDSTQNQFRFSLNPNEMAHIGHGQNTSLNKVKDIVIFNGKDTIKVDGDFYEQFKIKRSGLGSYVGITKINN